MRKTIALAALAAALSLPLLAAPTAASASCQDRKTTGTVIGGVGGALLGNSISKGGGGAIVGGLGGAVLGHEIAKSGCASSYRHAGYRTRRERLADTQAPEPARNVYYDQYGNRIVAPAPLYSR
jgi:uncharacterized protein YcfJ